MKKRSQTKDKRCISFLIAMLLLFEMFAPSLLFGQVYAAWDGVAGSDEPGKIRPLFDFTDLQSFSKLGFEPSARHRDSADSYSIWWSDHLSTPRLEFKEFPLGIPLDWSDAKEIKVKMYSPKATNAQLIFVVCSSPAATGEWRYYSEYFKIDWEGFKEFRFKFADMTPSRSPDITDMSGGIHIIADGGYGLIGNPESELYITSMNLIGEGDMYNFTESYYDTEKIEEAISSLKDSVAVYAEGANAVTDEGKIALEYDIDYVNKTVMVPINVFSDFLGVQICDKNEGYSIKHGGKVVWGKLDENQVNTDTEGAKSESFTLSRTPYEKNSLVYVPGEEIAKLLGFSAFSDSRLLCIGTPEMTQKLRRPLDMGVNELNEIVSQKAYEKKVDLTSFTKEDTIEPKKRWRERLVGNKETNDMSNPNVAAIIKAIDASAEKSRSLIIRDNPEKTLFPDIAMTESAHMTAAFKYITPMAKAYACYGSKYYQDKTMLADVLYCLDWMTKNYYSEEGRANWTDNTFDNWWDWNMGSAQELIDTLYCIEDALTEDQIKNYLAYYHATQTNVHPSGGANTANDCYLITGAALLLEDFELIIRMPVHALGTYLFGDDNERLTETEGYLVRDGKPIKKGTGFFSDGSYVFHYLHAMNGLYGYGHFQSLVKYEHIIAGTKFDLNNSLKFNLAELFFSSIDTINYGTSIFPGMRARYAGLNCYAYAAEPLVNAYLMAEHYDEDTKNEIYSIVKDTYLDTPYKASIISFLPIDRVKDFEEMIADESIKPRESVSMSKTFYNADRVIHKRENWAAGVAMSSSRVFNYECIGGTNLTGWYQGDGRTEWLLKDTDRNLTEAYWKAMDPYRMPGTTVDTQERKKVSIHMGNEYLSSKDFVGGVSLGNEYSIASMELESYHSDEDFGVDMGGYGGKNPAHKNDLTAKKSYFMTDDAVVCLGTDVNATDNNNAEVLTIVENILTDSIVRLADNSVSFEPYEIKSVDGTTQEAVNIPANTIDGNYFTKWAGIKDQYLIWDLGENKTLGFINLAFINGNARTQQFELLISSDGVAWESVFDGSSGGKTEDDEAFDLKGKTGRYIKFVNKGNSTGSEWVSISEASVYPPNTDGSIGIVADEIYGSDPLYYQNGELFVQGEDVDMTGITWANYNNLCGYWFPSDNKTDQLGTLKTRRTKGNSSCLEIWYSHGINPDKGGYAYALLPGADKEYTKAFAESGNVEILSNNGKIQAVKDKRTNTTYIVFWQAGEFEGIKLEKPGMVIARETDSTYEIAISDPTQKLTSNKVTINKALTPVKLDEFAKSETDGNSTVVALDMTYLSGRTLECVFKK